ncbi:hypothetical protein Bca4012_015942 [Brassica carinata]
MDGSSSGFLAFPATSLCSAIPVKSFILHRKKPSLALPLLEIQSHNLCFLIFCLGPSSHKRRALGSRLGQVGPVEAKTAKLQVELNAELPLKFALRAQLPSGEIVPVTLEYVNLHRWCHSCHLISHEVETCPRLSEAEREQHRLAKEANKDQGQHSRIDANRIGDLTKRSSVAVPKAPRFNERRSGERTQGDNRDSVWQRIDSRYAPRDDSRYAPREDYRENNRQSSREEKREDIRHSIRGRDTLPANKETYNKRRYDDSFAASRHREEAKRSERKHVPSSHSSKGETAAVDSGENQRSRPPHSSKEEKAPEDPPIPALANPQMAKQLNSSPDHVRDRPFRLNFQKKASGELKLKGKVGDAGEESDSVSSAQKSLNFADENKRSSPKPLSLVLSEETKKKSWYEIIVEEEEESGKHDKDSEAMTHQGNTGKSNEEVDPHAEKIFEEEDWMVDGENFDVDEDDLMEEDELLYDDDQKEDEIAPSLAPDDSFRRGRQPPLERCQLEGGAASESPTVIPLRAWLPSRCLNPKTAAAIPVQEDERIS